MTGQGNIEVIITMPVIDLLLNRQSLTSTNAESVIPFPEFIFTYIQETVIPMLSKWVVSRQRHWSGERLKK